MLATSTLRPGYLVSLKTVISGNVSYKRLDIEIDHLTPEGMRQARWETQRTIVDPDEHERAQKVRSKASSIIRGVCVKSAFGLLCPDRNADQLELAIAEARSLAMTFNAEARLTSVSVYVLVGEVAADDLEAARAIGSEVRGLLEEMEVGLRQFDVEAIRAATNKLQGVGRMLAPAASTQMQSVINKVRSTARKIKKASDSAIVEIDQQAIAKITEARTAFLELDEAIAIATPEQKGRMLDLPESSDQKLREKANAV